MCSMRCTTDALSVAPRQPHCTCLCKAGTPLTPGLLLSAHTLLPATGLVEEVEAVWDEVEAELEGAGGIV